MKEIKLLIALALLSVGVQAQKTFTFEGKPTLYINDAKYPSFVVKETLGNTPSGGIGLWVDIGTIGYFRDIKITKK